MLFFSVQLCLDLNATPNVHRDESLRFIVLLAAELHA